MASYLDTCPVCGQVYENYYGFGHRAVCSVLCQACPRESQCRHGYSDCCCLWCEEGLIDDTELDN